MASSPSESDPRWSLAHLLLLSRFARPRQAKPYSPGHQADEWKEALGESDGDALARLASAGLLIPCTIQERLADRFSSVELRKLLRERGLKVSGRKEELAKRLAEADTAGMEAAVADTTLMRSSERGSELAGEFHAREEAMEKTAFDAVLTGRFELAARAVVRFEEDLGFPEDPFFPRDPDIGSIRQVFSIRPKILGPTGETALRHLRIAAAMAFLGLGRAWLPAELQTGLAMENDAAVRMVVFAVHHKRNMESYRQMGCKAVRLMAANRGAPNPDPQWAPCEVCKAMDGRTWPIDEAPELPYEHCASRLGCRCSYSFILPGE